MVMSGSQRHDEHKVGNPPSIVLDGTTRSTLRQPWESSSHPATLARSASVQRSVLSALLGEMSCESGEVFLPKLRGRVDPETGLNEAVSFCAQQPWLEHRACSYNFLTLSDLVIQKLFARTCKRERQSCLWLTLPSLFGTPYDKKRYQQVLNACALVSDLKM